MKEIKSNGLGSRGNAKCMGEVQKAHIILASKRGKEEINWET
jgi:hypothetical protein